MLQLKNIKLEYPGKSTVLDKVSLSLISPGSYALMGASGSGKTTLLKAIAGLISPSNGEISGISDKRTALLFQEDRLLPWCSVLKNVLIVMPEPSAIAARNILSSLEINDVDVFPSTCSGGMKRRIALARAIAFRPDILLMDEPFNGLDEKIKLNIAGFIRSAAPLIIFSTHNKDDVSLMQVIATLIIKNGSIKHE